MDRVGNEQSVGVIAKRGIAYSVSVGEDEGAHFVALLFAVACLRRRRAHRFEDGRPQRVGVPSVRRGIEEEIAILVVERVRQGADREVDGQTTFGARTAVKRSA